MARTPRMAWKIDPRDMTRGELESFVRTVRDEMYPGGNLDGETSGGDLVECLAAYLQEAGLLDQVPEGQASCRCAPSLAPRAPRDLADVLDGRD